MYPWISRPRDLMEPWLLLPYLFMFVWMTSLLHAQTSLSMVVTFMLGAFLSAAILSTSCIAMVWSQKKDDESTEG